LGCTPTKVNSGLGSACKVFDEIPEPCVVSYNVMLDACGENGDMSLGLMFSRMPYRDVYSWINMIHGYMKNGCSEVAVKFFREYDGTRGCEVWFIEAK